MNITESTFALAVWCVSKRVYPAVDACGFEARILMDPRTVAG
ncbi:hypothetical protein PAMC26577_14030 [Caballeronia sordidicola]|uniref:Uncharacterized protein n=1 Tax=Caballeronia sordidicola TaxID=196367 RepID=A0A242MVF0_CABSO|nr:hypothetical protein PAMC26577_14030 [Caballeronia sordidicola]